MYRLLLALAVVLAACGGTAVDDPGSTTKSGVGTSPTGAADRTAAPDFTLELGTGGQYTLSESANPVYMVFWADW